jgi:hypothetical protein
MQETIGRTILGNAESYSGEKMMFIIQPQSVEVREQTKRNLRWLGDHWDEVIAGAVGPHVAIAGGEGFFAETGAEARRRAESAHPEDRAVMCLFVKPRADQDEHGDSRTVGGVHRRASTTDDRGPRLSG